MPQYALRCRCSATIPVGIAQAGMMVRCPECQESLEVPSTKVLRTLETLDDSAGQKQSASDRVGRSGQAGSGSGSGAGVRTASGKSSGSQDSVLQRVLPGLLLAIAAIFLTTAGVLARERWNSPIEFGHTEEEFFKAFRDDAMQDPPARVWDHWKYLVDTGLPSHQPPDYFVINEYFEKRKPWLIGSSIIGAISLGLFVLMTLQQIRTKSQAG